MILPPETKTKRRTNPKTMSENNEDRLSDLPDSILIHILSFLNTKKVFQTCILSKRWNLLTKNLPTLIVGSDHFKSPESFDNFVSRFLSLRDDSTTLQTLEFIQEDEFIEPDILKSIVEYAVSHNVERLRISTTCDIQQFPSCLFSCQTLTSLDLSVHPDIYNEGILFPNSLNLPALTCLTLKDFCFGASDDGCVEPFSAFNKLNTLTLERCRIHTLCISSTTLVNLTINDDSYHLHSYECMLSVPSICNIALTGYRVQKLCRSHLCSVKNLYIDVHIGNYYDSEYLLSWLVELSNIKSLTVTSYTLQVLSLVPHHLFNIQLTSLCNIESLQVEMKQHSELYIHSISTTFNIEGVEYYFKQRHPFKPDEIVDFLLQNSPSAMVTII